MEFRQVGLAMGCVDTRLSNAARNVENSFADQ
jgi:hypothetical protein